MVYIYILKLKNNKYYVGKTTRKPLERLSEHFKNSGSGWTRVHKPVDFFLLSIYTVYKAFHVDSFDK